MIRVNADCFRAAMLCASKEETRYYLQGVFVEPHAIAGVTLTTTDGHKLICIHDVDGAADESAIITLSSEALKACKRTPAEKRNGATRVVVVDGASAQVILVEGADDDRRETPVAISATCRIDGTFPDYRRVIPQPAEGPTMPGFYNAAYVAAFGAIAEILGAPAPVVHMQAAGAESPALVTLSTVPHAFGVIMPVRSGTEPGIPEWFNARHEAAAKAEPADESADLVPA